MEERQQLVGKLRGILRGAMPRKPCPAVVSEIDGGEQLPQIRRRIRLLAARYGWEQEIERALLDSGMAGLKHMDRAHLESLLLKLRQLENAVQNACDPPEGPPAR